MPEGGVPPSGRRASKRAVARSGHHVDPSSGVLRDELDDDRLRHGAALVSDDVHVPAADVHERVRSVAEYTCGVQVGSSPSYAVTVPCVTITSRAGMSVPAGARHAPTAEAGIPGVLLDV